MCGTIAPPDTSLLRAFCALRVASAHLYSATIKPSSPIKQNPRQEKRKLRLSGCSTKSESHAVSSCGLNQRPVTQSQQGSPTSLYKTKTQGARKKTKGSAQRRNLKGRCSFRHPPSDTPVPWMCSLTVTEPSKTPPGVRAIQILPSFGPPDTWRASLRSGCSIKRHHITKTDHTTKRNSRQLRVSHNTNRNTSRVDRSGESGDLPGHFWKWTPRTRIPSSQRTTREGVASDPAQHICLLLYVPIKARNPSNSHHKEAA